MTDEVIRTLMVMKINLNGLNIEQDIYYEREWDLHNFYFNLHVSSWKEGLKKIQAPTGFKLMTRLTINQLPVAS